MRRIAIIGTVLALCAALAGGLARAQPAPAPPLAAKLATCQTGATPRDRFAVFTGSMPAMAKATTLAMRFELLERTPAGGSFARVDLPRWGVWEKTSKARVPGFIFTKRVEQLAAPAAYRARLTFRWTDRRGRVLRTAQRLSPVCHQPDPRPDLHVKAVRLPATGPASVVVANRGRSAAGAFAVQMARAGLSLTKRVPGLAAGDRETVSFRIGRCTAGEPVTVTLDPEGVVGEAKEADDVVTVPCPSRR
jgi:hypothetical protein